MTRLLDIPIIQRVELHKVLIDSGLLPSCFNCMNSDFKENEQDVKCKKFNNQKPPLHVVVRGCRDWEQDIPF